MSSLRRLAKSFQRRLGQTAPPTPVAQLYRATPEVPVRGRMLLSYATQVYQRLVEKQPLDKRHVAAWQNWNITRAFLDLGFQVDVLPYNDEKTVPPGPYDVVIDVIANLERLSACVGDSGLRILHPTFAHWAQHNTNNYERHLALLHRRGVAPPPKKLLRPSASAEVADHIICRGGDFATATFAHCKGQIHAVPQLHPFALHEFIERDMESARRRFVWLGGAGVVHKGLDITLDAFADLPDCEVYICGPYERDRHFNAIYGRELNDLPNVHAIGWMDTLSDEWRRIVSGSATILMPSAAELGCGSLIAGMMSGMIPMATDEGDIDLNGVGVRVADGSVESLKAAVLSVAERNPAELADLSRAAYEAAGARYGRGRFLDAYRAAITGILGIEPASPWVPWDAEFRVPTIEAVTV